MNQVITSSEIKTNLAKITMAVKAAAGGRNVEIVAVSKNQPLTVLEAAYEAGIRYFGENKGQEVRDKKIFFAKDGLRLYFIGRLQENKIKYLVENCFLIQSIDSIALLSAVDSVFEKNKKQIRVLLQVNSSNETSKAGFDPEEVKDAWRKALTFKNVKLCGLMTIGAHSSEESAVEESFKVASSLFKEISAQYEEAKILSMGMTDDYLLALKYNSNMLRIGRAIFSRSEGGEAQ